MFIRCCLQRFRRGIKKQFKQDYYNWKLQRQQGSATPSVICPNQNNKEGENYGPILKASEVGVTLRTQEEHSRAANEQKDNAAKFIGTAAVKTPHLFQSQSGSVQRLENSHQAHTAAEFVNPNHFASDIAAALNKKKHLCSSQQRRNLKDDDGPHLPNIDTEDDKYMSFIEYIQLDVDSKPVDQFRISASFDSCHEAYIRFLSKYRLLNLSNFFPHSC